MPGNQAVLGFVSCQPSAYSVDVDDTGGKMTLTSLSGSFDPQTCMFSLSISGMDANEPHYTLMPMVGPSSMAGPAVGEYLQGQTVVIPAMDGAQKVSMGGGATLENTFTVTVFMGDLTPDGGS